MLSVTTHGCVNGEPVTTVIKDLKEVQVIHFLNIPWLQIISEDGSPVYKIPMDDKAATISQQYPGITPEQYDVILYILNGLLAGYTFGEEFRRIYNLMKTMPISDEAYNKYYMIKRIVDNESHKKLEG